MAMKSHSVLAVAVIVAVCAAGPLAAAQLHTSVVTMTTTGGANSVTLDVSIADNGALPGCTWFIITRDGSQIAVQPRQLGVQNHILITDTNVVPDHTYWYELTASFVPVPFPSPGCDPTQFNLAFGSDWGSPLNVPGHVGQNTPRVAHGKLVMTENPPYAYIEECGTSNPQEWFYFFLPPGNEQYIGQEIALYGEYFGWGSQNGWEFQPTSLALLPCAPLATRPATWGFVKSMYR
jgi:hypothetical protein